MKNAELSVLSVRPKKPLKSQHYLYGFLLQPCILYLWIIILFTKIYFPSGNWILERSIDGVTFEPWQYYAITDTECLTRFNITPRTGPPSYTRDDEVICTSFYSKIPPLENGEVTTDTY